MKILPVTIVFAILCFGCSTSEIYPQSSPQLTDQMYFPPLVGNSWETNSVQSLGWNNNAVQSLFDYLDQKHTKGFIVLQNGKIILEKYFNGHSATTNWYWASAGKVLTSATVGIAAQENLLKIDNPVSDYIGDGWSALPLMKERNIKVKNLMDMTSGIDDVLSKGCVSPDCLFYKADAGSRWAYDNVFIKLQDVVAEASNIDFKTYFDVHLKNKIGINGQFVELNSNTVYFSTTRSMARFGLLMLNKGKWENDVVLNEGFFNAATTTSQQINKSYGYLWWLNGKESYHLPGSQLQFEGSLIPNAPKDMFMALGKNDQKIYIVPSKKLVIVRMGESADDVNFALSEFDNVLWQKINALVN